MEHPERPPPYRERVHACIHPETFKYFLERGKVAGVWEALERRYGPIKGNGAFRMAEIEGEHFWLRAVIGGNPITVIRKRSCDDAAIAELHRLLGFVDADARRGAAEGP